MPEALGAIDAARFVHVSAISAWEISLLELKGQLRLPLEPGEWFERFIDAQGIEVVSLTHDIAFLSNELPWHHRDPADRFIIATALMNGLTIVTGDRKFLPYGVPVIA